MAGKNITLSSFNPLDISTAGTTVEEEVLNIDFNSINDAKSVSIQCDWSNFDATDGIIIAYIATNSDAAYINANSDETTDNATQKTIDSAAGSHLFVFAPADFVKLKMSFAKGANTTGSLTITVHATF